MEPTQANDAARFRAFGYTVLKACLEPARVEALRSTFERAMQTAAPLDHYGNEGSRLVSFGEDAGLAIAELVGHEGLCAALQDLLGAAPLYVGSFLMLSRDDVGWHSTGMPGEGPETVRAIVYLDESRERQGALHLLPGTHNRDYAKVVFQALGYWEGLGTRLRGDPRGFAEGVAVATDPGDVLIWYTRMWHASFKREDGKPRRGIYLSYVPDPGDDPIAIEKLRRVAQAGRSTVRPYLYGRELASLSNPRVRTMAARLTELGVPNVMDAAAD